MTFTGAVFFVLKQIK